MENNRVKLYFEDLTINAEYQLLEWGANDGKDNDELMELAIKKGIQVPSKDLAFFKCKYAMVDKANKNKCTLPRKEVKKALKTLNGKAIDKDHLRKSTIGHWLQAELDDNDIIAYGCFWKSNFPEDYEIIKAKMEKGAVKVSFEAWGERIYKDNGKYYDLVDIEFAGGALLFDTEPAFPDAEVLDFASKKEQVLEFAQIIEDSSYNCECIKCGYKEKSEQHCRDKICPQCGSQMRREERPGSGDPSSKGEENMEEAKFHFIPNDCMIIDKFLWDTECPSCKTKGMYDVILIDFEKSLAKTKCNKCNAKYTLNLEPEVILDKKGKKIKEMVKSSEEDVNILDKDINEEELEMVLSTQLEGDNFIDEDNKLIEEAKKLTYKERQKIPDDMFAVVVTIKNKKTGEPRKIRMFPIKDPAHVRNALARLPQATETLKRLGVSVEEVKKKILKRAKQLNMTTLLEKHKEGGLDIMDEILKKYNKEKIEDIVSFLETELDTKTKEISAITKNLDDVKTELEKVKLDVEKAQLEAKDAKEKLDAKLAEEKAAIVTARKTELGEEFAKDMSDEDILNDLKFELAKTKKELAVLKQEKGTVKKEEGLEAGTKTTESPTFDKQNKIRKQAYGD